MREASVNMQESMRKSTHGITAELDKLHHVAGRIRDAFIALVQAHARPLSASAMSNTATPGADVPATDILGTPRPANAADLGCFELEVSDILFRNGFETIP